MQIFYVVVNCDFHEYCYKEFDLLRIITFFGRKSRLNLSESMCHVLPHPLMFECI